MIMHGQGRSWWFFQTGHNHNMHILWWYSISQRYGLGELQASSSCCNSTSQCIPLFCITCTSYLNSFNHTMLLAIEEDKVRTKIASPCLQLKPELLQIYLLKPHVLILFCFLQQLFYFVWGWSIRATCICENSFQLLFLYFLPLLFRLLLLFFLFAWFFY